MANGSQSGAYRELLSSSEYLETGTEQWSIGLNNVAGSSSSAGSEWEHRPEVALHKASVEFMQEDWETLPAEADDHPCGKFQTVEEVWEEWPKEILHPQQAVEPEVDIYERFEEALHPALRSNFKIQKQWDSAPEEIPPSKPTIKQSAALMPTPKERAQASAEAVEEPTAETVHPVTTKERLPLSEPELRRRRSHRRHRHPGRHKEHQEHKLRDVERPSYGLRSSHHGSGGLQKDFNLDRGAGDGEQHDEPVRRKHRRPKQAAGTKEHEDLGLGEHRHRKRLRSRGRNAHRDGLGQDEEDVMHGKKEPLAQDAGQLHRRRRHRDHEKHEEHFARDTEQCHQDDKINGAIQEKVEAVPRHRRHRRRTVREPSPPKIEFRFKKYLSGL